VNVVPRFFFPPPPPKGTWINQSSCYPDSVGRFTLFPCPTFVPVKRTCFKHVWTPFFPLNAFPLFSMKVSPLLPSPELPFSIGISEYVTLVRPFLHPFPLSSPFGGSEKVGVQILLGQGLLTTDKCKYMSRSLGSHSPSIHTLNFFRPFCPFLRFWVLCRFSKLNLDPWYGFFSHVPDLTVSIVCLYVVFPFSVHPFLTEDFSLVLTSTFPPPDVFPRWSSFELRFSFFTVFTVFWFLFLPLVSRRCFVLILLLLIFRIMVHPPSSFPPHFRFPLQTLSGLLFYFHHI